MRKVILSIATIYLFINYSSAQEIQQTEKTPYHSIEQIQLNQLEYLAELKPVFLTKDASSSIDIQLPVNAEKMATFKATPRFIMDPKFQAKYPDIITYRIENKDKPHLKGRITVSPDGVFALIEEENGGYTIYPDFDSEDNLHYIQRGKDPIAERLRSSHCASVEHEHITTDVIPEEAKGPTGSIGNVLREYRFQAMTTGEFYQGNGSSFPAVSAVVTQSINGIELFYERDMGINFRVLNPIIRTDPFTDNLDPNGSRPSEAQREIENAVSVNSYDIGHVLHKMTSGGSGVAGLGVVCNDNRKASGWSGSSRNTTTGWYDLFGHEVGHMHGAPHTFNAIGGACTTNISSTTSYEIGSGSTIMSYNGSGCDGNIPGTGAADLYFHVNSLDRMVNYIKNTTCAKETDIGNSIPEVKANSCGVTYTIPVKTPFRLIGKSEDTEDVSLTYSWEQYDEDGPGTTTQGLIGQQAANRSNTPIFRSYPPVSSKIRTFPKMSDIINNNSNVWEVLSNVARILTFRFTARDNHQGGSAVAWDQLVVEVGRNGPMTIGFPNGGETVSVGNTQPFSWNLAGTGTYCDKVDVLLSLDGGNSFNIILAEDADYAAGTVNAMIPNGVANTEFGRIMVRCADTDCVQFFNVSEGDFTINSACKAESTNICPSEALVLNSGDFGLELGLNKVVGVEEAEMFIDIEETGVFMPIVRNGISGGCATGADNRYERIPFKVTTDGVYHFSLATNNKPENVSNINIFEAANFNTSSPCSSWVASNTTSQSGGGFSIDFTLSTELSACTDYFITFVPNDPIDTVGIINQISGPGSIIVNNTGGTPNGLAYTFLAVDIETDTVVMVRSDSDFKTLEPGSYKVIGVSYNTGGPLMGNPSGWIGLSIGELFSTGECLSISNNVLPLEVLSSCAVDSIHVLTQYPCNSNTNKYDQDIILYLDRSPMTGDIYINGEPYPIVPDPDGMSPFALPITLTDLESDGELVDLLVEFSEDDSCFRTFPNMWEAPTNCCDITIGLPDKVEVCEGSPVTLDASDAEGEGFLWYIDGIQVPNYTGKTIDAPETGFYVVSVTNAFGCSKTDTTFVLHRKPPNLRFTNSNPNVCDGQDITLALTNNARDSTFWYKDGVFVAEDVSSLKVTDAAVWEVHAINDIGCESRDTFETFVVPGVPEPWEDQFGQFCNGDIIALTAGTDPTYTYEWSVDVIGVGTVPINVAPNVNTLLLVQDGLYKVTITATNGCQQFDEINLNFNNLPVIEELIPEAFEFCEEETTRINIIGTPLPIFLYWTLDGEELDTLSQPYRDVDVGGTYTVHGANSWGCISDTLEIELTSFPLPVLSGVDYYNPCENDPIILTVDTDGDYQYSWTKDGVDIPGETSNILDATAFGSGDYQLTAVSDKDCIQTFDILVEVILNPYNEYVNAPSKICLGEEITLVVKSNLPEMVWYHEGVEIIDPNATQGGLNYFLKVTYGGNFTARAVNNEGCEIDVEFSIEEDQKPAIDGGPDIVSCDATGLSITLETDATPSNPYTYMWWISTEEGFQDDVPVFPPFPPPADPLTVNNLQTGDYVVRATSQNGCITFDTISVSIDDAPMLNFTVSKNEICTGETATIVAETNNNDITWYKDGVELVGETDLTLEVTDSGEYSALVVISSSCEATQSTTITAFDTPILNPEPYDPICLGVVPIIDAMPDQGGYTYVWSINGVVDPSLTTASFPLPDGLTPRTYTFDVVASNGPCTDMASIDISILNAPTLTLEANLTEACAGDDVILTATTGLNGIVWSKDDVVIQGETGMTLSVTESGTYKASVSSGGQCDAQDQIDIEIFASPELDGPLNISACEGNPINIDMSTNGDFDFTWTVDGVVDPSLIGEDITIDFAAGDYVLELTAVEGICSDVHTIDLSVIAAPTMTLSAASTEICTGDVLTLTANTNLSIVTWLKDGVIISGETGLTLDVTESGVYMAMVSGGTNCDASDEISISVLDAPVIAPQANYSLCAGEDLMIDLDPSGMYTYEWKIDGVVDPLLTSATVDLSVVLPGDYTYEVTAFVGSCSTNAVIDVSVITSPSLSLEYVSSDICTGDQLLLTANTNLSVVVWEKDGVVIQGETSTTLTVNEEGTYTATVSGGNNCDATDNVTVNIFDAPVLNGETDYGACEGQTVTIDTEPGGNYTYVWSVNGIVDPSLTGSTVDVTETIGDYTYSVVASLGSCEITGTYNVNVISAPSISLSAPNDFICNGGSMTLVATSNISGITWLKNGEEIMGQNAVTLDISEGGVYTAFVSGGNNCEASDEITINGIDAPGINPPAQASGCEGDDIIIDVMPDGDYVYEWKIDGIIDPSLTTSSITVSQGPGDYTYEVTASDGECGTTQTIDVSIITAPTMDLTASETSVCEGTDITLIANTNLTTVVWEKDGVIIQDESGPSIVVSETGTYTATVSAGMNCGASDMISVDVNENPIISVQQNYSACEGVNIEIEVDEMGDYTYTWEINGSIDPSLTGSSIDFNEPEGNYDIVVTAINGICTATQNIMVDVFGAANVSIEAPTTMICEGETITITANTNVSELIWSFNGSQVPGVTGPSIDINTGGLLAVFADGGNNCSAEDVITIEAFPIPDISTSQTQIGGCQGTPIDLIIDANGDYSFEWDLDGTTIPNQNQNTLTVDQSGTYTATAFGENNCSNQLSIVVVLQDAESITLPDDQQLCEGDSYTINANTISQNVVWYLNGNLLPGVTGNQYTVTESGIYTAESISPNDCRASDIIVVNFNPIPVAELGPATQNLCEGTPFSLNADPSQGSIEWFKDNVSISTDNSIIITESGLYKLVITNSAGCFAEDEVQVIINNSIDVQLGSDRILCEGTTNQLSFNGPSGSTYQWTFNGQEISTDQSIEASQTGTYGLLVTSNSGCSGSDEVNIEIASLPNTSVPDISLCPGESQMVTTADSFVSYRWSNGSTDAQTSYTNQNVSNSDITSQQNVLITDSNGCQNTIFFNLTAYASLDAAAQQNLYKGCPGFDIQLEVSGGNTYEWVGEGLNSNSVANPIVIAPTESMTYEVNISNSNCPSDVITEIIEVQIYPSENTGISTLDTCIIPGVEFDIEAFGGVRYDWGPDELIIGSDRRRNPTIVIEETSIFNVEITDVNGCSYLHEIEICAVEDPEDILTPITIMSPNNDGMNDNLIIKGLEEFPDNQITIFNRWGNLIFEARGYQQGNVLWDGTRDGVELPADTYYYVLKFGDFVIKKPITIVKD